MSVLTWREIEHAGRPCVLRALGGEDNASRGGAGLFGQYLQGSQDLRVADNKENHKQHGQYTKRQDAGEHLADRQREILGTAWNQYVNRCARISLRHFARVHNIPFATWQREFRRGAASPIVRRGNRWTYPEYDMDKARASINEGKGCMDAPMKLAVAWRPSSSGTRYWASGTPRTTRG